MCSETTEEQIAAAHGGKWKRIVEIAGVSFRPMGITAELNTMESSEDKFENKKDHRNPLVPLGALATAAVLCGGLYSFKQGKSHRSQMFMRARVVMQGATVALMVGTVATTATNASGKQ